MALTDGELTEMAQRLIAVPGVVGVVLGGSRARHAETPASDTDLGLYYRAPFDTVALGELAVAVAGEKARVTEPGEWGPWVDGGGWLRIDDHPVDWIYRDLDRVHRCWEQAEQGHYAFHAQGGHPLGVTDFSYAGELALGRILADPTGELNALRRRVQVFPRPLAQALVAGLWEADFLVGLARKGVARFDTSYVAGCLFRLVGVCAYALHGAAGQWLINEKGAVAAAGRLPGAPAKFQERVDAAFGALNNDPLHLTLAIDIAADLVLETTEACAIMLR